MISVVRKKRNLAVICVFQVVSRNVGEANGGQIESSFRGSARSEGKSLESIGPVDLLVQSWKAAIMGPGSLGRRLEPPSLRGEIVSLRVAVRAVDGRHDTRAVHHVTRSTLMTDGAHGGRIGVSALRIGRTWHGVSVYACRLPELRLGATRRQRRAAEPGWLLIMLRLRRGVLSSLRSICTAVDADSTRANTARCLDAEGRARKGRGVDGRHPDPSLVDLEEVGHQ